LAENRDERNGRVRGGVRAGGGGDVTSTSEGGFGGGWGVGMWGKLDKLVKTLKSNPTISDKRKWGDGECRQREGLKLTGQKDFCRGSKLRKGSKHS